MLKHNAQHIKRRAVIGFEKYVVWEIHTLSSNVSTTNILNNFLIYNISILFYLSIMEILYISEYSHSNYYFNTL